MLKNNNLSKKKTELLSKRVNNMETSGTEQNLTTAISSK